jgi:hypothetical protein
MKVDELRVKLLKLDQKDLIRVAVEFYKLIPKSKKEDNNLDALIDAPEVAIAKPAAVAMYRSMDAIEAEVNTFITHAREQNYLMPNRIIVKKERSTWRFKVKAWYKEIVSTKNASVDIVKQAEVLSNLYQLLCDSCRYQYFSSDDPFSSVGITQTDFYRSVLQLIDKAQGKVGVVNRGIGLIINNTVSIETLYSYLMDEFILILGNPDAKYAAIDLVNKMIADNKKPTAPKKSSYYDSFDETYRIESKNNNLAEFGYRLYASLFEFEEAIQFYKKHAKQSDSEVKLYILINLLFENRQKEYIKLELQEAAKAGEKLRPALAKLLKTLENTDILPERFY